jgi:hypothetical protein
MSSFGSPNRAGVMSSLPPEHRGAGSGMNTTFQNSAKVLSIGIFFTVLIVGLSTSPLRRLGSTRGPLEPGFPCLAPAPRLHALCRFLGLQPCPAPDRAQCPGPPECNTKSRTHRPELLPQPDRRAVSCRPSCSAGLCHRGQPVGCRCLMDPRRAPNWDCPASGVGGRPSQLGRSRPMTRLTPPSTRGAKMATTDWRIEVTAVDGAMPAACTASLGRSQGWRRGDRGNLTLRVECRSESLAPS